MVDQVCLWMGLLVIFGTTETIIRFVSFFVADVASSLEALVLVFLVLAYLPLGNLLSLRPLEVDAIPFESSITLALDS